MIKQIPNREEPVIIFDVGSRDCMQSCEFAQHFPNAKIYAFECNPNTLDLCKQNIKNYSSITLVEGAVCDYDGDITFYPIDQSKTITTWKDGNPGASSIYKSNGNYTVEKYVQNEITTNAHRLDTVMEKLNIPRVDYVWMDLQGAELLALKGLGKYLKDVRLIHTEVTHTEMYTGQVLFDEFDQFMTLNNFRLTHPILGKGWQEDAIYAPVSELAKYEKKMYSQNGEDGITLEILKRIDHVENYVEFGVQDGTECNTRILDLNGWTGLQMDGGYDSNGIKKEFVTRENVIDLFKKYSVPNHIGVLSVDTDYNDFYIVERILNHYTADLVIVEYNASWTDDRIIPYKLGMWDGTNHFGASLKAWCKLFSKHNYSLVYTESKGVNAFFVRDASKFTIGTYSPPRYGNYYGGHPNNAQPTVCYSDVVDSFDIVIPVGPNDLEIVKEQLPFTMKNVIGYRNIYLIGDVEYPGTKTIPESNFPFSIDTVAQKHGVTKRCGWYLQQLLKLYAGRYIDDILDRYLVIDADTFFLKPTHFVENGKSLYAYGTENHLPYFEWLNRLLGFGKLVNVSGICHHMMFEKRFLDRILTDDFVDRFLDSVTDTTGSGASEYEMYFNWLVKYEPKSIKIRPLKWKNGNKVTNDLDYISYHWYLR